MHSYLGDMNGVEPLPAKDGGRIRRQSLVEKNSFHAT
jgi:hypothetical protein